MPIANFAAHAPLAGRPQAPGLMQGYVSASAAGLAAEPRVGDGAMRAGVPAPRGVSLSGMNSEGFWSETAETLRLPPAGVVSVWATRLGDMKWEALSHAADTNISLYFLSDASVRAATQVAYGDPLPFVAIVTAEPMTETIVKEMWEGTAYAPHRTEAIYRQSDTAPVPVILFLHWGERNDSADAPQRLLSLESAAARVQGQLMFGIQVPAAGTTQRDFPATPFDAALPMQLQLTVPGSPGTPAAMPSVVQATTNGTTRPLPWKGLALTVGVAAAIGTYFWQTSRRRS